MPRHARFKITGLPLHVGQRGNDRSRCFFHPEHHELFLGLLSEFSAKCSCAIHAYVLMTNHVHLLMTPTQAGSASQLMKQVGQRYAQYINRTRTRTGSFWEGRFHSNIVDSETYLLRCYRYIESNPVRAGMVRTPEQYPWSSFNANALGAPSTFLIPHPVYLGLGDSAAERQHAYRALFERDLSPGDLHEIRRALSGGFVLGSEDFAARVRELLGRRVVAGRPGRPKKGQQPTETTSSLF